MYPGCYVKLDNIELECEPELTPYELKWMQVLNQVDTASHALLDEIYAELRVTIRGRRPKLAVRRASLRTTIEQRLRNTRRAVINNAKRSAFIGPMTIQQQNGHPF